jgi:hypothetical protein
VSSLYVRVWLWVSVAGVVLYPPASLKCADHTPTRISSIPSCITTATTCQFFIWLDVVPMSEANITTCPSLNAASTYAVWIFGFVNCKR